MKQAPSLQMSALGHSRPSHHDLADRATHERDAGQRRHMLDIAGRIDTLAPPSPAALAADALLAHLGRKPS